jgi:CDP-glycerol glycerophosphotransferase
VRRARAAWAKARGRYAGWRATWRRRRSALAKVARRRGRAAYYRFHLWLPIRADLAVYAAYWYRGYACNPRAIHEKAAELVPHVRGVWVVDKRAAGSLPPGVDHVIAGSRAYLRLIARAKYFVNNVNFPGSVVKRRGAVHLMTQHGTPLKVMGLDLRHRPAGMGVDYAALLERTGRYDLMISSNPLSSETWRRAFPGPYELLEIGYPRVDRLLSATEEDVARLRAELGVPAGATAVLYAPTHRDWQRRPSPVPDAGLLAERLGPGYLVMVRAHYFDAAPRRGRRTAGSRGTGADGGGPGARVLDVSGHPSVEDLCLASDVLITDYSSIMFDYALLDRPIIIHAPDWESYRAYRGVNFDLFEEPPGVVTTELGALVEALRTGVAAGPAAARRRAEYRRRFCPWDDGRAADRAVRRLFRDHFRAAVAVPAQAGPAEAPPAVTVSGSAAGSAGGSAVGGTAGGAAGSAAGSAPASAGGSAG